jgi:hypothetical protein
MNGIAPDPDRTQPARGPAVRLALLVVAVTAVVAVAAAGGGILLPPVDPGAGWTFAIRLAGLAAAASGLAGLAWQRRRMPPSTGRGADPSATALSGAALLMAVLATTAFLAASRLGMAPVEFAAATEVPPDTMQQDRRDEAPSAGAGARRPQRSFLPITAPGRGGGGRGSRSAALPWFGGADDAGGLREGAGLLRRAAIVLLALLILGSAIVAARILARPVAEVPEDGPHVLPLTAAVAALEASLADVAYDGSDPRRRITAAYHRLLRAVAGAGSPRQPQEAPHEHLRRSLEPLGVDPEPMHLLAELYVRAQFGHRPIREEHCTLAAGALEASLRSLRAFQTAAEQAAA